MGCSSIHPTVLTLVNRLAKEHGLDLDLGALGVESVSYRGPHRTPAEKLESFLNMLDSLQAGRSYVFVDHPGLDTPEMRAIHHLGYEDVAQDRQGVTDTWTHPRVLERVKALRIQLIGHRDLRAAPGAP
jgi:hypothetical protein